MVNIENGTVHIRERNPVNPLVTIGLLKGKAEKKRMHKSDVVIYGENKKEGGKDYESE